MLIPCPYCGSRLSDEFSYLGDASVARPRYDAPIEAWNEYVYLRENPAGPHKEFWYHGSGCHAWLVVNRDTTTHRILSVDSAAERGA